MPDENKLKALRTQGVRCVETCATCKSCGWDDDHDHNPKNGWRECFQQTYTHQKTGKEAWLPVHETMWCPLYEWDAWAPDTTFQGQYYFLLKEE